MCSTREELLRSVAVAPVEFVVEVGAGHNPFHATDLIVDKYPFENLHRVADLVHAAPVIKADATKLPLPARGCDLLLASHVLEHLREPDKLIEEAKRCAHRVYFEFPSMTRELMYAWSFHEWLIEVKDRHLVFFRNDIPQFFGDFFHGNHDMLFETWSSQRFGELNNYVYCESGELTYEFPEDTALQHIMASAGRGAAKFNQAPIRNVRYSWRRLARLCAHQMIPERAWRWAAKVHQRWRTGVPRPLGPDLVERLMCQSCGAQRLSLRVSEITCDSCGARYIQRMGVFDFDT